MIPEGWSIKESYINIFQAVEIKAPTGHTAIVYVHERNPANILYMLAKALLDSEQGQPK